jgi:hypothetical protein
MGVRLTLPQGYLVETLASGSPLPSYQFLAPALLLHENQLGHNSSFGKLDALWSQGCFPLCVQPSADRLWTVVFAWQRMPPGSRMHSFSLTTCVADNGTSFDGSSLSAVE